MISPFNFFQIWRAISEIESLKPAFTLTQRVMSFGINHFGLSGNACVLGYGIKELFLDSKIQESVTNFTKDVSPKTISQIFSKVWSSVLSKENFSPIHGTLLLNAGSSGVAVALHSHHYLNLGSAYTPLGIYSNASWFFANLLALKYYVESYQEAEKLPPSEQTTIKKHSAFMGILNSLSYVLSIGALVMPNTEPYLILCGIGITTGCTKIVYDYFFPVQGQRQ